MSAERTISALDLALTEFAWLEPVNVRLLHRLNVRTWRQLLDHYPRRHEDRQRFGRFPTGASDTAICVKGLISKVSTRFGRGKITEVTLEEEGGLANRLVCRWFNQHYLQRMLAAGQEISVFGRPKEIKNRIIIDHPEFEILESGEDDSIHLNRIVPVYALTDGLRQRPLRALVYRAVQALATLSDRELSFALFEDRQPKMMRTALSQIHFPDSHESWAAARTELALFELVTMQITVEYRRRQRRRVAGQAHTKEGDFVRRYLEHLSFEPTKAQKRAIAEVLADLRQSHPMARLLQGDVGAGKTLVATAAMLKVVENGRQALFMAPTQVLADQHYLNLASALGPLGVNVGLRTSNRQVNSALELAGTPDIVVGTHALLYESEEFDRVGIVVIDEQHKFGVLQRSQLIQRVPAPDLLVMSATPIPRTLAMTVYGDLDLSVLDEKPANRRPIITRVRPAEKIPEAAAFLRERIAAGRQIYIIYPLVSESESVETKSAEQEITRWREWLAPAKCGLLHGRLTTDEKANVMSGFRSGKLPVLVATSVVEVGVDVPNATVMLIENPERFGLAQLHQLRGRIGRSLHQSYCVLLSSTKDDAARAKLEVLEKTEDGFAIAEADLEFRGPGDLLGTAQSGLPPLRLANLTKDGELLKKARLIARNLLDEDFSLAQPEHALFREAVIRGAGPAANH